MFGNLYEKLKNLIKEYREQINAFVFFSVISGSMAIGIIGVRKQIDFQVKLLEKLEEHNKILLSNILKTT
jgi:hypothetical protein